MRELGFCGFIKTILFLYASESRAICYVQMLVLEKASLTNFHMISRIQFWSADLRSSRWLTITRLYKQQSVKNALGFHIGILKNKIFLHREKQSSKNLKELAWNEEFAVFWYFCFVELGVHGHEILDCSSAARIGSASEVTGVVWVIVFGGLIS